MAGKEAAKAIRKELKAKFPNTKFSVRSDYNSVRIEWTDGYTLDEVDAVVQRYKAGSFNGMIDMYEYDHDNPENLDRAQYIFTTRNLSIETELAMIGAIEEDWCENPIEFEIKANSWSGKHYLDISHIKIENAHQYLSNMVRQYASKRRFFWSEYGTWKKDFGLN